MTRWNWKRWAFAIVTGSAMAGSFASVASDDVPKAGETITLKYPGQPDRIVTVVKSTRKPDGSLETEVKDGKSGETFMLVDPAPENKIPSVSPVKPAASVPAPVSVNPVPPVSKPAATTAAKAPAPLPPLPVPVTANKPVAPVRPAPVSAFAEAPAVKSPAAGQTPMPPMAEAKDKRLIGGGKIFNREPEGSAAVPAVEDKKTGIIGRVFGKKPTPTTMPATSLPVPAPVSTAPSARTNAEPPRVQPVQPVKPVVPPAPTRVTPPTPVVPSLTAPSAPSSIPVPAPSKPVAPVVVEPSKPVPPVASPAPVDVMPIPIPVKPAAPVAVTPAPVEAIPVPAPSKPVAPVVVEPSKPVEAIPVPVPSKPVAPVVVEPSKPVEGIPVPAPSKPVAPVVVEPSKPVAPVEAIPVPPPTKPTLPPIAVPTIPAPAVPAPLPAPTLPSVPMTSVPVQPAVVVQPAPVRPVPVQPVSATETDSFIATLKDAPAPSARLRAVKQLSTGPQASSETVKNVLFQTAKTDVCPAVKADCIEALAKLDYRDPAFLAFVRSACSDESGEVRLAAKGAWEKLGK
ncbi:MAG: HEAT repeat domain-containing protein [Gemmataceae bacterium]